MNGVTMKCPTHLRAGDRVGRNGQTWYRVRTDPERITHGPLRGAVTCRVQYADGGMADRYWTDVHSCVIPVYDVATARRGIARKLSPVTVEYAGYVIRDTGDGWVATKDGVNMNPGACFCETEDEALQVVDVLEAVGGDVDRFWHLHHAILRAAGRLK